MMCERLLAIEEDLVEMVEEAMEYPDCVNTKEMGEVIDMIKDLSKAVYNHTVVNSMKEKEDKTIR